MSCNHVTVQAVQDILDHPSRIQAATNGEECSRRSVEQRQRNYHCETDCAAIEPALTKIGLTTLRMDTVTGDSPHFCIKNRPKNLMVMPAWHIEKA